MECPFSLPYNWLHRTSQSARLCKYVENHKNPEALHRPSQVVLVHNQGIYRHLTINTIRQTRFELVKRSRRRTVITGSCKDVDINDKNKKSYLPYDNLSQGTVRKFMSERRDGWSFGGRGCSEVQPLLSKSHAQCMHRTQDTGHRTQDTGHRTQDTGHRTQDTGHRTQDTEDEKK
eukprot:scaffold45966_cov46-Attheya_sp.AAC.7